MPTREELIQQIQRELARRQEQPGKPRITTREQALEQAMSVDAPLETPLIAPDELIVGPLTGGLKAAGMGARALYQKTVGGALGKAAAKQEMINTIKGGSELAPWARGKIDEAISALDVGRPGQASDQALRELIKGKTGQINPDVVAETFPNYAKKLAERRAPDTVKLPLGGEITTPGTTGPVDVPLERLLRLKRASDKAAGFSKSQAPFSESAASRVGEARRIGDVAREQIYQNAPGSEEVLSEMGKNIKLKKFLTKRADTDPVGLLKAKQGTTKDSILAQVGEKTGVDIRRAGDEIESAINLQLDPKKYFAPLEAPGEARKLLTRGVIQAGSAANRGANLVGDAANAVRAPEILGFAGAREAASAMSPAPSGGASPEMPSNDRQQLIKQIQDEIARRSGH